MENFSGHEEHIWYNKKPYFGGIIMTDKKLISLTLICVFLCVGIVGALMTVNQNDSKLQTKNEQISGLENEKLTLETKFQLCKSNFQVSNLNPIH
jgi:hypothetical protein